VPSAGVWARPAQAGKPKHNKERILERLSLNQQAECETGGKWERKLAPRAGRRGKEREAGEETIALVTADRGGGSLQGPVGDGEGG
jgi:hypothetical protein